MPPPERQTQRDLEARSAELERRLREVRRAIAAAERGRPVELSPELRGGGGVSPVPGGPVPRRLEKMSSAEPETVAGEEGAAAAPSEPASARGSRGSSLRTDRQRFAHYFGSSFLRTPPPSVERRLQRNRALVMLIVVAILAYIVYSLAR